VLGQGFGERAAAKHLATMGKTVTLDGEDYEVIGKLPASFRLPPILIADIRPDVYVPIPAAQLSKDRQDASLSVIGRLKAGTTLQQAQAEMTTIASRLAK
jgi:hypothetical protein